MPRSRSCRGRARPAPTTPSTASGCWSSRRRRASGSGTAYAPMATRCTTNCARTSRPWPPPTDDRALPAAVARRRLPPSALRHAEVLVLEPHVVAGAVAQLLDLALVELAHEPRRVAQPQLTLADGLARRHDRAGPDEAERLHHRAVEHGRPHADQREVADPACVHDGAVANGDIAADHRREAARPGERPLVGHVHHGAILDVGARADLDRIDVAADHAARPDGDVVAEADPADDGRSRIDVHARAEGGKVVEEGSDAHAGILPAPVARQAT